MEVEIAMEAPLSLNAEHQPLNQPPSLYEEFHKQIVLNKSFARYSAQAKRKQVEPK